jgi:hypothetical protein
VYTANGRDDVIVHIVNSVHHLFFGGLMMISAVYGNPVYFRYGLLGELGYEVQDVVVYILGLYPYCPGVLKPGIRVAIAAHHMPCMTLSLPCIYLQFHHNPHMRWIGA